jgi:hypothetical protein
MAEPDTDRIAAWPRLTRFYGISPIDLATTPNLVLRVYVEQLDELEARERLHLLQISDYPHLTPKDRAEMHRNLMDMANIPVETPPAAKIDITSSEGRRALHGLGIKVVADPAPGGPHA